MDVADDDAERFFVVPDLLPVERSSGAAGRGALLPRVPESETVAASEEFGGADGKAVV